MGEFPSQMFDNASFDVFFVIIEKAVQQIVKLRWWELSAYAMALSMSATSIAMTFYADNIAWSCT